MPPLTISNTITINASRTAVWNALTSPEQTRKYMFGCEALSDWSPGSPLVWQMELEGSPFVAVKGHVVRVEPETRLDYTVFDPNSTIEDVPENYLTVTYELTDEAGQTRLRVTQGDYNTVADGARRYQESYNNGEGWHPILVHIKELVEQ